MLMIAIIVRDVQDVIKYSNQWVFQWEEKMSDLNLSQRDFRRMIYAGWILLQCSD